MYNFKVRKDNKYQSQEFKNVIRYMSGEMPESGLSWVAELESQFAKRMGVKYAIACNSGTSGLHAALYAAGVGQGDEVIQPAITVVMDTYVTHYLGAVPIYADIEPHDWNISIETIKKKITEKTKAIIVVSLYGLPVDIEPIMQFAKEKNLMVIDDSAETLDVKYMSKQAGTIADLGVYSFENSKHMTTGSEGGMVITDNEELAERVRKFAGIGYKNLTASVGRTSLASRTFQNPNYERFEIVGYNYRMNQITAAIGLGQLKRLSNLVKRRKIIGAMFKEAVEGCSWIKIQSYGEEREHSYFTFGLLYEGEAQRNISWEAFYDMYVEMGGDGFYGCWLNPYNEPSVQKILINKNSRKVHCPVADEYQKKIMAFKTNYRDLKIAKKKVNILKNLIDEIGR